jgi:hypothetical protein
MTMTWREDLEGQMMYCGDPGPVVAYAPSEDAFDVPFDENPPDGLAGPYVLAWTKQRVYFPVWHVDVLRGRSTTEWLGSAPRHPQAEGQRHIGLVIG